MFSCLSLSSLARNRKLSGICNSYKVHNFEVILYFLRSFRKILQYYYNARVYRLGVQAALQRAGELGRVNFAGAAPSPRGREGGRVTCPGLLEGRAFEFFIRFFLVSTL